MGRRCEMIRVILDGGVCEPVASQRINMAYDAGTLTDMQAWREGRSLTVRLPSTAVSDRLMCNADDIHSPDRFNSRLHTASVEVDGVELLRGTATLRSVVRAQGLTYYDVMIRDGGAEWAKSASLTMLRDSEVEFSTLLDSAGIAATWQGDKAVRFLPVVRDSYSSDSTAEGLLLPQQMLMPQEYHPFLSVEAILRSIFLSAGYELCSEFMQSSLFKSLYMSGAYEDVDAAAARAKMDFLAGRQAASTATADAEGIVYAWEPKFASNIGAFVDTVTPPPDIEPAEVRSGLFSTGGCMSFVDGRPQFKPTREICVGFEYYIKYATEYRIASRTRLRGFDAVHVDRDCDIDIGLANPFEDRRGELRPQFQYRVVVFDHKSGDKYRLGGSISFASRTALITTPSDVAADLPLTVCRSGETTYRPYDGDWALYDGYIEECGTRDVELRVRTPPEQLSPSSPKVFNFIYFHGAEEGQQLTLSERCTLRPIFSGEAGYGSVVSFADVACHRVRQSGLIEAIRQMFNLHIYSDQNARKVYIEPYDDFFGRHTEDWRGRQLTSGEQRWSDTMLGRHELQTWRYGEGDGVVGRFGAADGNELGQWTFATEGCGTLLGRQTHVNPPVPPERVAEADVPRRALGRGDTCRRPRLGGRRGGHLAAHSDLRRHGTAARGREVGLSHNRRGLSAGGVPLRGGRAERGIHALLRGSRLADGAAPLLRCHAAQRGRATDVRMRRAALAGGVCRPVRLGERRGRHTLVVPPRGGRVVVALHVGGHRQLRPRDGGCAVPFPKGYVRLRDHVNNRERDEKLFYKTCPAASARQSDRRPCRGEDSGIRTHRHLARRAVSAMVRGGAAHGARLRAVRGHDPHGRTPSVLV